MLLFQLPRQSLGEGMGKVLVPSFLTTFFVEDERLVFSTAEEILLELTTAITVKMLVLYVLLFSSLDQVCYVKVIIHVTCSEILSCSPLIHHCNRIISKTLANKLYSQLQICDLHRCDL